MWYEIHLQHHPDWEVSLIDFQSKSPLLPVSFYLNRLSPQQRCITNSPETRQHIKISTCFLPVYLQVGGAAVPHAFQAVMAIAETQSSPERGWPLPEGELKCAMFLQALTLNSQAVASTHILLDKANHTASP